MKITINRKTDVNQITRPACLFGIKEKFLYVMCDSLGAIVDANPSYFMTTGINSPPILFWYNDRNEYEIAPTCKRDLDEYAKHVYVKLCKNARANLVIDID
jgi:hypothetical protein